MTNRSFVRDMLADSAATFSYPYAYGCLSMAVGLHSRSLMSNRDLWLLFRQIEETEAYWKHLIWQDLTRDEIRAGMEAWASNGASGGDSTLAGQDIPR